MGSNVSQDFDEVSTVLNTKFDPSPMPNVAFVLRVVEGPAQGEAFVVDPSLPSRALVGQGPACTIRVRDPEVSRRHAAIEFSGSTLRISDLESTNGTFVDGVRIVEAFLCGGETIRMGRTAFHVEKTADSPRPELPALTRFGRVVGASTEMRRLYPLCERLASSNVPVIIEGETGTGKEALAEALHEQSPRASGPFIVFDCTSVPPSLVESELFGHERGAFTGAVARRKGVFELAHGGTLLIDEIGDFDLTLQPKLLRALERSEVRRVGGDRPIPVDVRVLAATRRELDGEVAAGRFRDDLFHRLAVTRIELPPLRRRRGDIALLATHFCSSLGGPPGALPNDLLRRWEVDPWPGNVRQLRNAVARHLAVGDLAPSSAAEPSEPAAPTPSGDVITEVLAMGLPLPRARQRVMEALERRYVEQVLAQYGGDTAKAAAASGIARRYFNLLRSRHAK
jgi:DNA-binding NtrC family response regulator